MSVGILSFYDAIFETDGDNDFDDFIEYFDNQWW